MLSLKLMSIKIDALKVAKIIGICYVLFGFWGLYLNVSNLINSGMSSAFLIFLHLYMIVVGFGLFKQMLWSIYAFGLMLVYEIYTLIIYGNSYYDEFIKTARELTSYNSFFVIIPILFSILFVALLFLYFYSFFSFLPKEKSLNSKF